MRLYTVYLDNAADNDVKAEPFIRLSRFRLADGRVIPVVRIGARKADFVIPVLGAEDGQETIHSAEPVTTETGWPALAVAYNGSESGTWSRPIRNQPAIVLVRASDTVLVRPATGAKWRDLVQEAENFWAASATDRLLVMPPGEYVVSLEQQPHNGIVMAWDGRRLQLSTELERRMFGNCSSVEV